MTGNRGKFLTYEQKKQAEYMFNEYMLPKDLEPGAYQWQPGWNDAKVAEEIGAHTSTQVASFRTELGFKLQNRRANEGGPSKNEILLQRIMDCEEQAVKLDNKLAACLGSLQSALDRITRLEALAEKTFPKKEARDIFAATRVVPGDGDTY